MSDRLAELRRQRALIQDHLTWLDREIAAEAQKPAASGTGAAAVTTSATPAPAEPQTTPLAARPATTVAAPTTPEDAEAILAQYRASPDSMRTDVRKGCWLYFVGAFALLGIVIAVLYITLRPR